MKRFVLLLSRAGLRMTGLEMLFASSLRMSSRMFGNGDDLVSLLLVIGVETFIGVDGINAGCGM